MAKIRILVVDDSVVVRRLLARLLSSDPLLEVVASAPSGRVALAKLQANGALDRILVKWSLK